MASSTPSNNKANRNSKILTVIIFGFIIALAGVVGGIIGNLWGTEFDVGRDNKFDIFASLLTALLTVLGFALGAFGLALYSRLEHQFDERSRSLDQQFSRLTDEFKANVKSQIDQFEVEVKSKADGLEELASRASKEASEKAQRTVRASQIHFESGLAISLWEMGMVLESQENPGATGLFEFALDRAEEALSHTGQYLDLSIGWDRVVDREIKNTVAWLYAHLDRKDHIDRAYEIVRDLRESVKGKEDETWWILDTCNYVQFKLPRYPDDPQKARESVGGLLVRSDIPEKERALWKRLYKIT